MLPFLVFVHSVPVTLVLVALKKELPLTMNSTSPPRRDIATVPPVAAKLDIVQTVVVLFVPAVPPRRSTCRTGLSTGLLNVNITVCVVPFGDGLTIRDGLPATDPPYGLTQKFVVLKKSVAGARFVEVTPEIVTVTPAVVTEPPDADGVQVPVVPAIVQMDIASNAHSPRPAPATKWHSLLRTLPLSLAARSAQL